ncbi:hypothetical protein [Rhodococcus erythropolis]|uniref:Helix-turn-helix DNA binding domain protein n=1 Tax=Rhodococcus erythropolis (strain PR4 / NBRC 100887) TaxID=234621 RepID=C0ZXA5_RHOE4|nr:hypothetical protein [Rhodococcus erythropolis]BAH32990.1 hypothetical protein RER_22820 [Rhodococcus erythropolis PR4]
MASEFTRMNRDIWSSDEFLDLSASAQHLYFVLWTHPNLSFCGSVEWHPGKLSTRASDLTPELVIEAGMELARNLFIVVDPETEEVLVRSWIKHDGLCRQPNMAVAMSKDRANLSSRSLRGVVVHEVAKLRVSEPGLSAWKRDQVVNLLGQNAVDPAELLASNPWLKGSVNPSRNPSVKGSFNPSGNPSGNPKPKGPVNPGRTTTTATATQTPTTKEEESSYVSTEGYDASATEPPPRYCPQHVDEPTTSPCHACGEARRAREVWDRNEAHAVKLAQSSEAKRRAKFIQDAIDECELCDERGYFGTTVCEHNPERVETNRRGVARVREALAETAKRKADDEQL